MTGDFGAYGLRIRGVAEAAPLLVSAPSDWPLYSVESRLGTASGGEFATDEQARLLLRNGGEISIDRSAAEVVFTVPEPVSDQALVHPYLAPAAAVIARWLGREPFHAGAFALAGGAWGVLGEREAGKSSLLAWLSLQGRDVVCDDMLVVSGETVFAGPRSVDLRRETAERLGAGEELGVIGARERWRVVLPPVEPEVPLAGWVFLEWGEDVSVTPVEPGERLARLIHHRGVRLPPASHEALLGLAALPAWEVRRPPDWASLADSGERLLDVLDAA